jgi:outer membrane biosynthesis protein TonB
MSNQLEMNSGPRFVKPAIIGAIALLFAGGIYTMSKSSATIPDKAAEPQTAMAGDGNAPAAAEGMQASTPGAPSPTADMSASSDSAAAAPTETAMATPPPPAPAPATPAADPAIAAAATPMTSPEPAVAAAPEPKPAAQQKTAGLAAAPKPAPTSEPVAEAASSMPPASDTKATAQVAARDEQPNREAVRPPATPAVDALRPWWNQGSGDDRFGVQYVGQAADQPALVIRFSRQVTDPAAAQNIKLIGANGQPVTAAWAQGQSPNVLYAPNLQPGRYTVVIDPQMASSDGQALGTQLHGPTYIR